MLFATLLLIVFKDRCQCHEHNPADKNRTILILAEVKAIDIKHCTQANIYALKIYAVTTNKQHTHNYFFKKINFTYFTQ